MAFARSVRGGQKSRGSSPAPSVRPVGHAVVDGSAPRAASAGTLSRPASPGVPLAPLPRRHSGATLIALAGPPSAAVSADLQGERLGGLRAQRSGCAAPACAR